MQAHAVMPAVARQLRRIQFHLLHLRQHNAVARALRVPQRGRDARVGALVRRHALHQIEQMLLAVDFAAARLAQNPVEQPFLHMNAQIGAAIVHVQLILLRAFHVFVIAHRLHRRRAVAHTMYGFCRRPDRFQHRSAQPVIRIQSGDPARRIDSHLAQREFQ